MAWEFSDESDEPTRDARKALGRFDREADSESTDSRDKSAPTIEHPCREMGHAVCDGSDVPGSDFNAISRYSHDGYRELNDSFRNGNLHDVARQAQFSHDLSECLKALPEFEGLVYRGSDISLPGEIVDQYVPGRRYVERAYTSATTDVTKEFGGNVLWVIDSKHGRDISAYSAYPQEAEVVFDRFAKFDVLEKRYSEELRRWIIRMSEV